METKRAKFIGFQQGYKDIPTFALFNIEWEGNELNNSTVGIDTVVKLGITELVDKQNNKLLSVPEYKK